MIKILSTLVILLTFVKSYSQNYYNILGDSNTWYVLVSFEGSSTKIYTTKTDTIINNKSYKIFGVKDEIAILGYIREDSFNRKVYLLANSKSDTSEFVYYDFTLKVNDSISLFSIFHEKLGWYYVDSIKTVNTLLGSRKAYYLKNNKDKWGHAEFPIWIEGVGTLSSPDKPNTTPFEFGTGELSCFYRNGIIAYQSEKSIQRNTCNYTEIANTQKSKRIIIYPNPASSYITIEIQDQNQYSLSIFDLYGKLLQKFKNPSILDLKSFSDGLYILRFNQGKNVMIEKLIIKK